LGGIESMSESCLAAWCTSKFGYLSYTLFNVHMNDIEHSVPRHLEVSSCKYADDCTEYDIVQEDDNNNIQDI
jgi:hypothetical protein